MRERQQERSARIESGIVTAQVAFYVLFNMLVALGFDHRVVTRRAALERVSKRCARGNNGRYVMSDQQ
jgi:hypothetical protein